MIVARTCALLVAMLLVACATDTLRFDEPKAVKGREIAPYEFHEECAQLATGDRIDYRFESTSPVLFEIYYKDGLMFVAPTSRDAVTEHSGVFPVTSDRRYCLRWEAGAPGAVLEYRIRLLHKATT